MTSGGRYQSRFLNFLHRQSLRLVDRSDRAWRHLKVATEWAAQAALYPIYLLLQTTQLAGKQLQQAVQQTLPRLQAGTEPSTPTPDTPIESVLQTAKDFTVPQEPLEFPALESDASVVPSLPKYWDFVVPPPPGELTSTNAQELTSNPSPSELAPPSRRIQGVASLLGSHKLVLVNVENQILDLLSDEQQAKLNQRIIWEVANYYRYQRQRSFAQRKALRLRGLAQRQGMLPPVRWFWQAMDWVQTGPVASTLNLFGESTLLSTSSPQAGGEPSSLPFPDSFLTQLDRAMVEIEQGKLAPVAEWGSVGDRLSPNFGQRAQQLVSWVKARFFGGLQKMPPSTPPPANDREVIWEPPPQFDPLLYDPWDEPPNSLTPAQDRTSPPAQPKTQRFQLEALLQAAVDYFFGSPTPQSPLSHQEAQNWLEAASDNQTNRQQGLLPPEKRSRHAVELSKPTSPEVENWLTLSDLFGETETSSPPIRDFPQFPLTETTPTPPPALPTAPASPPTPEAAQTSLIRRSFQSIRQRLQPPPPSPLVTPTQSRPLARKPASPSPLSTPTQTEVAPVQRPRQVQAQSSVENPPIKRTNHAPEANPDWIETPAKSVGYVQTPLERLLEALDRLMFKLETWLGKIWQELRRLFK
ncbi:MAG: hypothetical protein LRZ84_24865 [Desertifilum sp.]|nr:hypothetical protein [Desertifilum sp.]